MSDTDTLAFSEVVRTRKLIPGDMLPDGRLARALRVLRFFEAKLTELEAGWLPVDLANPEEPASKAIADLFFLGLLRIGVANETPDGKPVTIIRPANWN